MNSKVMDFYDAFGSTFIHDLIHGNRRVQVVHNLFRLAIPPEAESILIVGCGYGRDALVIAKKVAPKAKILAIDISENNIRFAEVLHSHPRVVFRRVDILENTIEGQWQYIIFPDVYEHIPKDQRSNLHARLKSYLTDDGRIILTCPTPWHQEMLRKQDKGLQIVDEDVTTVDVQSIAEDIGGHVSLYRNVSVWNANDYFHAIIDKQNGLYPLGNANRVAIKGNPSPHFCLRVGRFLSFYSGIQNLHFYLRARSIKKKLRNANLDSMDKSGDK